MVEHHLEFVHMPLFERTRKNVLNDEEVHAVENQLLANPAAGVILRDTGGVRKLRAALENRGKRGSVRIVYYYHRQRDTIYFILAFAKNVQASLTPAQRRIVRELVAAIEAEAWPPSGPRH
jgi:hypothetical protein